VVSKSNGSSQSQSSGNTGSTGSRSSRSSTAKAKSTTTSSTRRRARTSEASAAGTTARARLNTMRSRRAGTRPRPKPDTSSIAEPTVTATDDVLAASNAQQALNPDMPRVAWLRTQLQNLEAQRAERLVKVAQLTLIAIVFITFVLQNANGVNVHFLVFALNIRLIWVIFGCGLLGGVAGYLIGRPDKSLRALLPHKEKKPHRAERGGRRTAGS
jgi:uncharacterized integral membrane protein